VLIIVVILLITLYILMESLAVCSQPQRRVCTTVVHSTVYYCSTQCCVLTEYWTLTEVLSIEQKYQQLRELVSENK